MKTVSILLKILQCLIYHMGYKQEDDNNGMIERNILEFM